MVYCSKCGKQNAEDAKLCVNCGADLYPKQPRKKEKDTCFGPESHEKEECFGLPYSGVIASIVFGLFIIIIGFAVLFGENPWRLIWPFGVLIFGILIVAGALYRLSRKPKR